MVAERQENNPSSLSVQRAFVIYLGADTQIEAGHITGNIEHVVSGESTRFDSSEALFEFLAQKLKKISGSQSSSLENLS